MQYAGHMLHTADIPRHAPHQDSPSSIAFLCHQLLRTSCPSSASVCRGNWHYLGHDEHKLLSSSNSSCSMAFISAPRSHTCLFSSNSRCTYVSVRTAVVIKLCGPECHTVGTVSAGNNCYHSIQNPKIILAKSKGGHYHYKGN